VSAIINNDLGRGRGRGRDRDKWQLNVIVVVIVVVVRLSASLDTLGKGQVKGLQRGDVCNYAMSFVHLSQMIKKSG
jgi:hypothetical protein